jgi:hypothetical protein
MLIAVGLAAGLAWSGPAPAWAADGAGKPAPDCCPDLSPFYPKNRDSAPDKARPKKRRVPPGQAVKVHKPWSPAEAPAPAALAPR